MTVTNLLILGIAIGSNNLAAALALGALGQETYRKRIITVFGAFEFFIPLLGIWAGRGISRWLYSETEWVGPAILGIVGLWMIISDAEPHFNSKDDQVAERVTTWSGLMILASGLSIDNLIIGFSLGLGGTDALVVASTIAIFSVIFTYSGLKLGKASRKHWQRRAKIGSGLVLIGLAVAMVLGWI